MAYLGPNARKIVEIALSTRGMVGLEASPDPDFDQEIAVPAAVVAATAIKSFTANEDLRLS